MSSDNVLTITSSVNDINLTATFGDIVSTATDIGLNTGNDISITAGNNCDINASNFINQTTPNGSYFNLSTINTGDGTAYAGTFISASIPNISDITPTGMSITDGIITNTINKIGYTTRNSVQNSTHFLNFSDSSSTGISAIQKTAGIECNPSTKTITATTFNGDLSGTATNATNVGITSDNTSGTYYLTFAKTSGTGNKPLFIDDVTAPLTYNASTGTLNSTIFSTATAPVSANQLGNKTYIDNYGGTGGWYYTTTISPSATTTLAFPNCLDSNYNAYEIYFISNLSSPTTGYVNFQMSFSGITTPTYQSWVTALSSTSGATPAYVNSYQTTAPYLNSAMDFSSYINRAYTYKMDLWGTKTITGGASTGRFQYLTEGQTSSNPGFTGYEKRMGSVGYASGNLTGITLTASSAVTGQFTIVVKAKY